MLGHKNILKMGNPILRKNKVVLDNVLTKKRFVINLNKKIDFLICEVFFKL